MPAGFFLLAFLELWLGLLQKWDAQIERFGQIDRCVVDVLDVAVGLPEIEDVSLSLALGIEAAEDVAFDVC